VTADDHAEPLRIGVLGASRIAETSIVSPAKLCGHRLVAVAARDPERARVFADQHGIERVLAHYDDVIADPEVEVVYNPLPNGLHAPWNLCTLDAGKHVLTEKPSAANARDAATVEGAVERSEGSFMEGFHYLFHPLFQRVLDLVGSGAIGEMESVDAPMRMEAPGEGDPRWDLALAGGAVMDLGCYSLHAARVLGQFAGGEPHVVWAEAGERDGHPGVDEWLTAELVYPSGAHAVAGCHMDSPEWDFSLTVVGTNGTIHAPNFVQPHLDDRLVVTDAFGTRTERLGTRSSYTFQLEAFAAHVREGTELPIDARDATVHMELIDATYAAAGLDPRPSPVTG
jgi:predicted dehydrogenase